MIRAFILSIVLSVFLGRADGARAQTFSDQSSLLNSQDETLHGAWGASIADMDGNGLPDIYEPGILYLQQEDGSFVSSLPDLGIKVTTTAIGATTVVDWGEKIFGSVMADVDDDGFSEMVVMDLTADSSHFYKGRYGLRLDEVGPDVGIVFRGLGQGSTFADLNGDGPIDLFFGEERGANQLFLGDGTGMFSESSATAGISHIVQTYGVAAADYDNDGDLDIFIAACSQADPLKSINLLFRNRGDGTFEEVGAEAGINDNGAAWGISWLDYDQDGFYDAYVANMLIIGGRAGYNKLYRNKGDGTFEDVSLAAGVRGDSASFSFGSSVADFDNDGLIDIYVANNIAPPNMYRNNGDGTFTDVYLQSGLFDLPQNFSVAVADLNDDGWIDIYTGADRNPLSRIFMNDGGTGGFLKVNLIQEAPNRNAIGARIEAWNNGVRQMRDITSGDGFTSQNMAHTAHFGVGNHQSVDSLIVRWPDGSTDVHRDIARNSKLWLQKGGTINEPPGAFRALTIVTKQAGKRVTGYATWEPSVDPEGQQIAYKVAVRDPSGSIIHESEPLSGTEYTFDVGDPTAGGGDYRFIVTATDGIHHRRSVNTGGALIEGTSTHSVEVPESFSVRSLYPQPAPNVLNVDIDLRRRGALQWEISNLVGRTVLKGRHDASTSGVSLLQLDVSGLAAGIYGLTLSTDELVERRTLVIAR